jgi:hypothetical protein
MKKNTVFFVAAYFFCNMILFAQVSATISASDPRISEWLELRKDLESGILQKDETKERKATQAIWMLDTDKMPSEWRFPFVDQQLFLCHRNGDWQRMVAIKNKLMSKKRVGKKDDLIDAALLREISGYYAGTPYFPPPKEVQKPKDEKEANKFALEYFKNHYKDPKERERILLYIVENFDPDYAPVYIARTDLAGLRLNMDRPADALATYQAIETQDFKKLYCLPQIELWTGRLLSGKEVFDRLCPPEYLNNQKNQIYQEMLRVSDFLEASSNVDKAIEELRALRKKHLDAPELCAKIETRLRELSLKSDLIIPAEELGLPKVTTGTLRTSGTLSVPPKK